MNAESLPFEIEILHRETVRPNVSDELLRRAAAAVLTSEHIVSAEISLVLTDDAEIHRINVDFLGHDYPTDVISFLLNADEATARNYDADPKQPPHPNPNPLPRDGEEGACSPHLDGELIISVETAERAAGEHGCSFAAEMVLYVVHGLLHLCGYDDQTDLDRATMRQREQDMLTRLNLSPGTGAHAPAVRDDNLA